MMRLDYDESEDILYIRFSLAPIVRDVPHGWNVNLRFSGTGPAK
jgi:uncharacterized protein YbdZ (MbtH family)